ncbi:MAG TPA: STAS/SEC14 domain-containing protein [Solirubrobacterales bacterium]|nr:STAS/SEC14 domain-containing protein [Solirubrobacterales bacterium]
MIEPLEEMPQGTVGFRFSGKVSRADYDAVLVPALEAAFESGEVRCLCQLGPGFEGYEAAAAWEDAKVGARFGIGHASAWKRTALVTDVDWVRHLSGLFGWMTPGELKLFGLDQLEEAKAWVAG